MAYLLGIDQGTTQTTSVALDESGKVLTSASASIRTSYPQAGWVEQDPWDILQSVLSTVSAVCAFHQIAAVGLDNQGESFLLWDAATGQPLTPVIGWQDKRGQPVCDRLARQVDPSWLRAKTGLILDSYFSAPKLYHILHADPSLKEAARAGRLRFGTVDTWLIWQLSNGRLHITDASTASRTLLFNINSLAWDDELLALFDIPRTILPEVRPSAGYVGDFDFGAGRRLPLYGLLVDQQAALFGQACFRPGDMKCTFGTGSFLLMNTGDTPQMSAHGLLTTVAWQRPDAVTYALDGGVFVTGAAVQWLADTLHLLPDVAASSRLAEEATGGDVTCVPALAGLAAPHWLPDVRGAFFGLSRATTPADMARATLEGICCRVFEVVAAMEKDAGRAISALKVDGGPTANSYLMQCLADTIGVDVCVAATREATATGVASLAGHAALGIGLDEIAGWWQAAAVYHPRLSPVERAARLNRWQRAVAAVRAFHTPQGQQQVVRER
jgi:glycerol kinase